MSRQIARSVEELDERYGCVPIGQAKLREVVRYGYIGQVTVLLNRNLPDIVQHYDLKEIYIRPTGDGTVFEPLEQKHFPMEGEISVIASVAESNGTPRIVGIMMAKDEADAIPEVCASLRHQIDALYYHAQDAATAAALAEFAPWARQVVVPAGTATDGLRCYLLNAARIGRETDNDNRPMWVISVQGDEIYHDNLRHHIALAYQQRATALTCQVATFMLHESQRDGWDWTLPLDKRLTHYIWDFGEFVGFHDFPWIYYDPSEHMRAHPHGIYPAVWANARPVRKHYPFRSPEQAAARIADRIKSGWQPHYENYRQIFFKDGDKPAGRELKKFHGWFGEAERIPGIW